MNRIYSVIYSEAKNGYVVVSELARRHGKHTRSRTEKAAMTTVILTALASFTWAGMSDAQAARIMPLTVTEKGQSVNDDFDVKDCNNRAVLEIRSTAATDKTDVTVVNTKNIKGTFSNKGEANGIWVQDNYPGTVKLADGLHIKVNSDGNRYITSGIYLKGVDTSLDPDKKDESVSANKEYIANRKKISDTRIEVGNGTSITLEAGLNGNEKREYIFAEGLENKFGYMAVGNNVNLSLETGAFKENYSSGFSSHFYGDTIIGSHFTSTAKAIADKDTIETEFRALESAHDRPDNIRMPALTQNNLIIGGDAHLKSMMLVQSSSQENRKQQINNEGMILSHTNFSIGNRLTVETSQEGVDVDVEKYPQYDKSHVIGIFVHDTKQGTIGAGLTNTVTVNKRNDDFTYGVYLSGWQQRKYKDPGYHPTEEDKEQDISDISIKEDSHNHVVVTNSAVKYIHGIILDSNSKLYIGNNGHTTIMQTGGKASEIRGIAASSGSTVNLGEDNHDTIKVDNGIAETICGINAVSGSVVNVKKNGTVSISQKGGHTSSLSGIYADTNAKVDFCENSNNRIAINHGTVENTAGVYSTAASTVNLGANNDSHIIVDNGTLRNVFGIFSDSNSAVNIGKNGAVSIIQKGGESSSIYGIENHANSNISADDGFQVGIDYIGAGKGNLTVGIWNYKSQLNLGNDNDVSVIVKNTSKETVKSTVSGIRNVLADSSLGKNLHIQVKADDYETIEGIRNTGVDLNSGNQKNGAPANMTIGDNLSVTVKASDLSNGGAPIVEGIRNGTNHLAGYTFTDGKNTMLTVGKNAHISVTAPDKVTDVSALHTFNHANAEIGDGAVLTVNSTAQNRKGNIINNVVKADDAGQVTFDGGMVLSGSQNAIYSTDEGSSISAIGEGRKVILGDLESAKKGAIQLKLNTSDSLFRGKSTFDEFKESVPAVQGWMTSSAGASEGSDTNAGIIGLTIANGARWDMTGSSQLSSLEHENGGLVDMAYTPSYQRLDVNAYGGKNGLFRMKTDLASQTDGDKVYMDHAAEGAHGLVQVHDKSFLLGKEVTGTKHLLLITDESKNATFSGKSIDEGGLWDVTPTIENGSYVRNTMGVKDAKDTQWYLTKLEKSINKDTKPLLDAADYAYGSYRMDIETLRQRMGELRFLKDKQDESGIWARMYGGEFDGPGYDSRYHALQLGYDYAANPKSFYGWFGERGIASPHYDYGTSSNHSLTAGIYGTWFGDSGVYTDAVAKWGRDDVNLHTSGSYPDQANYRTRAASLSLEYGKTMKLNDKGVFIEPQAQLVYGHLGSTHYTTAREKQVHLDDYDSFIGRVGFVFGRRTPDATKPLDYYLRLSALHEFGGRRAMHLSASDGETMDWSRDYGSTWYEASLGGTYRLSDRTTLYGDVQRSFGSDWHKKWQGNIGINWQF